MRPRPGAPTQPEATAGDRSATLTWTIPTDYLTKWEYRAGTVVGGKVVWGEWEDIGFGSARNGDAEGLTNGTAYTFQVRAFNDAGDGEPSPASETVIPRQSIGDLAITGAETPRLPEHSEDVVATYVATFPAGHSISWSLVDQYDDDAFSIDGGLLSFRAPPDFEAPIDTGDYTDANGNTDPNGNNVYHVTVRIDDAGSSGGFSIFDVTVTVTNVDEPGRVELSSTAPKVGDRLTAELTDPDMGIEVVEWHWQALPPGTRSTHPPTGPGESTDPSLLVTSEHIGLTLSAQVTYLDGESNNANDRKSAQSAATAPVVDVPSAPRELEAAAGNARVDLRWDPPLTDNGSALTGYGYRYGSGGSWTPGTLGVTTSHTIDQLTNGLEYSFEVRAVNGAGEGASASDTATPRRPDTRGRVEWSTTQPRVGQELTPTLLDPDTPALAEARWRWRRLGWLRSDAGDSLSAPAPESRSGESKLVSCRRNSFTKSLDFGEDGIRRSRPDERVCVGVPFGRVAFDSLDELRHLAERIAPNRLAGEDIEPDLHLIEPRSIRGSVVKVKSGTPCQPSLDLGMLMRGVVVDDEMNIEVSGHVGLDVAQELEELLVTMTGLALGHHFPGGDVQGGKQGGGAVPLVVVRNPFHVSQSQGQHGLTSFQRLDLALLVHAQHQGVLGGIQVQADDIPYFVDKERIGGKLEALVSMGLQTIRAPNAMNRVLGQAGFFAHGAHRPLCFVFGLGLQGLVYHLGYLLVRDRSRRP